MFKEMLNTTYGPHVPGTYPIFTSTESNIRENLPIDTKNNAVMYLPKCTIL